MDASQDDHQNNPEQPPKDLANKYRVSWHQASEAQRQAICKRFGLTYTYVGDEGLLQDVAVNQQAQYRRSRTERQQDMKRTARTIEQEQSDLLVALRKKRK